MSKNTRTALLLFILYGTMFIFGFVENTKGVSYPLIKAEFGISYETQGLLVSLCSLAHMLFCLVGGILLGRSGIRLPFNAGFICMTAGLTAVYFLPGFRGAAGALILVSTGFGFYEVSLNALASRLFLSRTALFMSLLNFFYGVGSSLSLRSAGALTAVMGWRKVYILFIPLVLAVFIPSLFARFPREEAAADNETGNNASPGASAAKRPGFLAALKNPLVWLFSVSLGFQIAVELYSVNWAGLYYQDMYGLDPKTAGAAFISNFYILFTVSRLLSGFIIEKAGYIRSLFIASAASLLILVLGLAAGKQGVYVLPALGVFTAIFWPTTLAAAMGYFGKDAPVMTSAIIVIAGATNSCIQFFIGALNRRAGPAWGYRSCLVYIVIVIASLAVLSRCVRRPYRMEQAG